MTKQYVLGLAQGEQRTKADNVGGDDKTMLKCFA